MSVRLIARNAEAKEIDTAHGSVRFDHPDLLNGCVWIEPGYRPPGVVKGDLLDIYYLSIPHKGWYEARRPGKDDLS